MWKWSLAFAVLALVSAVVGAPLAFNSALTVMLVVLAIAAALAGVGQPQKVGSEAKPSVANGVQR